jgi:hypothetical protein
MEAPVRSRVVYELKSEPEPVGGILLDAILVEVE